MLLGAAIVLFYFTNSLLVKHNFTLHEQFLADPVSLNAYQLYNPKEEENVVQNLTI